MTALLEDSTISFMLKLAMVLLCIAIILALVNKIIQGILRSKDMAQRQNLSVFARYRNKVTAMIWADAMDIRIGGILPIGEKVEDFLWAMFPRSMEELEKMRLKNPEAWRQTMKYLLPLIISLKMVALYKGQEALNDIMGWVQNLVQGPKADPTEDKSVIEDSHNGKSGG